MGIAESCIHKWAYRLAPAPGTNREIADATVAGCRDAIMKEGNLMFKEQNGKDVDGNSEAAMFKLLRVRYADLALFHVVQARAGKCDVP
jgi:hypothetical protein